MNGYQLTLDFATPPVEETNAWLLECLERWRIDQLRLHHQVEPFYSKKKKQLFDNQQIKQ